MKYGLAFLIVLAVAVGFYFLKSNKAVDNTTDSAQTENPSAIVVEVARPGVFSNTTELRTGNTVMAGATITTDKNGIARIHFPAGSSVTISPESAMTVTGHEFNAHNKESITTLFLAVGKIYSQVVNLVTPQSVWEVKTANAVAVVRGTAFGVAYSKEKSEIVVKENIVTVAIINPQTQQVIPGTDVVVQPNKFLSIDAGTVAAGTPPQVQDAPPAILQQFIIDLPANPPQQQEPPPVLPEKPVLLKPAAPEARKEITKPEKLILKTSNDLKAVREGDQIIFEAILLFSNDTRQMVTDRVQWTVVGPIGIIEKPGIFLARLDDQTAESGSGSGGVRASFTDKAGATFTVEALFDVRAFTPAETDLRG